jgi:hypothetical protein
MTLTFNMLDKKRVQLLFAFVHWLSVLVKLFGPGRNIFQRIAFKESTFTIRNE